MSQHYGEAKETVHGLKLVPLLDGLELKEEWVLFKQMMAKNFGSSSIQGMAKKLLDSEAQEQFPQTLKLIVLLPDSSVDCERGFSKQNLIKTKIRAKLKTENVSTLMKMSLDTPEIDFHRAFVIWCTIKDRVICRM